jgi:Transcriptional regulator C-terminal region
VVSSQRTAVSKHRQALCCFFRHVQAHHQLYKALVRGEGIQRLFKKSHRHLRRTMEQHLATMLPAESLPLVPFLVATGYIAGAILNMPISWLEQELPYTPERMDARF